MQAEKFSVSLSSSLIQFVGQYKSTHACESRSQVIETALQLLQAQELEEAYRQAAQEVDPIWNAVITDGLADEIWI